jgi:DNA-binding protein H-NS
MEVRRGARFESQWLMKQSDIEALSIDELWRLHGEIAIKLARKMRSEKRMLENRLRELNPRPSVRQRAKTEDAFLDGAPLRRPYPAVLPKYRNPDDPSETWSGRGKQPRWLAAQLNTGRQLDEFRIRSTT